MDGSPPGSAIPGILQARTLEWVAIFLLQCMEVKSKSEVTQSCPNLHDPMDCSPPGSSVHGILQARTLEWGAIAFSNNEFLHVLIYLLPNLPWGEGSKKYFLPGRSIEWRRQWQPTPVLLPGKSHGQRSLVGCRPWGRTESDTTETT